MSAQCRGSTDAFRSASSKDTEQESRRRELGRGPKRSTSGGDSGGCRPTRCLHCTTSHAPAWKKFLERPRRGVQNSSPNSLQPPTHSHRHPFHLHLFCPHLAFISRLQQTEVPHSLGTTTPPRMFGDAAGAVDIAHQLGQSSFAVHRLVGYQGFFWPEEQPHVSVSPQAVCLFFLAISCIQIRPQGHVCLDSVDCRDMFKASNGPSVRPGTCSE